MRCESEQPFEILAKEDVRFCNFHGTMESIFQQLYKKGVGAVVKHTFAINDEEGSHIWQSGIIGDHSPTRADFYLNGINFSLRGGKEHRDKIKTIQSRTRHTSVEALRVYGRPIQEQQTKACRALPCTKTRPVTTPHYYCCSFRCY